MNSKTSSVILYLACLILGIMFSLTLLASFVSPPVRFSGWVSIAARAYGLYCIYRVIRFKERDAASNLSFVAVLLSVSSFVRFVIIASRTGQILNAGPDMFPLNNILWFTLAVMLVEGCMMCICGALLWLPSVKKLLASDSSHLEFNDDGISIGPPITMSGPEFLQWTAQQSPGQSPEGHSLYIKIPEPLLPDERGQKYAQPIDDILEENDLGYVDGGGTMIGRQQNQIEFIGIDAVIFDREKGLEAVIQLLQKLNAPEGTEIHLLDEDKMMNVWNGGK